MSLDEQSLDLIVNDDTSQFDANWPSEGEIATLPAYDLPDSPGNDQFNYLQSQTVPELETDAWSETDAPTVYHLGLLNRAAAMSQPNNDFPAYAVNAGNGSDANVPEDGPYPRSLDTYSSYDQNESNTFAGDSLADDTIMGRPVAQMGESALRLSVSAGSDRVKQLAADELVRRDQAARLNDTHLESDGSQTAYSWNDAGSRGTPTRQELDDAASAEGDVSGSSEPEYIKGYAGGWTPTAVTVRGGDGWINVGKRAESDPRALAVVNARDGSIVLQPGQVVTVNGTDDVSDSAKAVVQHIWDDEAAIAKTAQRDASEQRLDTALRNRIIGNPLDGFGDKLSDGLRGAGDILASPVSAATRAVAADDAFRQQPYIVYSFQDDNGYQDMNKVVRMPNPAYVGSELKAWDGTPGLSYPDALQDKLSVVPGPLGAVAAFPYLLSGGDPANPNLRYLTKLADITENIAGTVGVPLNAASGEPSRPISLHTTPRSSCNMLIGKPFGHI